MSIQSSTTSAAVMPASNRSEPEAYAVPGYPVRYRRRVKSQIGTADIPVVPYSQNSGSRLLTEREQQVLEALAEGLRSGEIAKQLNTSVKKFYAVCDRLCEKLGAKTEVHAVSIGFRRGLLILDRRGAPRLRETSPVEQQPEPTEP
jgi:DNA-binding CsgD family transcriptional regulator